MATQKVLFPYNFTRYDKKASDFVIRVFSRLEDVEITSVLKESGNAPSMPAIKKNLSALCAEYLQKETAVHEHP